MSRFALDILGAWPVYPGHPCTLALLILRKYPQIDDAFAKGRDYPNALSDNDIPGAGGCVYQALDLIRYVRQGTLTPEQASAWGVDEWREQRLGGDHPKAYESGVAEAERIAPMLLEELRRVANSP